MPLSLKLVLKLAAWGVGVSRTNLGLPANGHFPPGYSSLPCNLTLLIWFNLFSVQLITVASLVLPNFTHVLGAKNYQIVHMQKLLCTCFPSASNIVFKPATVPYYLECLISEYVFPTVFDGPLHTPPPQLITKLKMFQAKGAELVAKQSTIKIRNVDKSMLHN